MAKIAKKKAAAKPDIELNRWCVEMAMQWPVITSFSGGGGVAFGGSSQQVDADVLGRAAKIMAWIKASHT